jgi:hypothetical protein
MKKLPSTASLRSRKGLGSLYLLTAEIFPEEMRRVLLSLFLWFNCQVHVDHYEQRNCSFCRLQ